MAARDSNDQPLGEVIKELLNQYNLEGKLQQARLVEAWPEVTGSMITRHTRDLYIKGKTLFVKLDSPALKNELLYSSSDIAAKLNEVVGEQVIDKIAFI
jgi:predicted nucleic acid-binding Zn ribbon protein